VSARWGAGVAAIGVAIAGAVAIAQPSPSTSTAAFDHASHVGRIKTCEGCHASGPEGKLVAPSKPGHQPCLASGCHVDDFLASGATTKAKDPARHAKAAAFCGACHEGVPDRASQPKVEPFRAANRATADHHVELDHAAHTARTACRSCHAVDATTLALRADAPGHAECATCHGHVPDAGAMDRCALCHAAPSPAAYFGAARRDSDVRSCGTAAHADLATARGEAVPFFKHERPEHRARRGKALECGACHYMIDDRARWGKHRYGSLKELRAAPIIHNQRDQAHAACGASGCHAPDVEDRHGSARCGLCHSKKVVEQSVFD
jgi:hypothetical protein